MIDLPQAVQACKKRSQGRSGHEQKTDRRADKLLKGKLLSASPEKDTLILKDESPIVILRSTISTKTLSEHAGIVPIVLELKRNDNCYLHYSHEIFVPWVQVFSNFTADKSVSVNL